MSKHEDTYELNDSIIPILAENGRLRGQNTTTPACPVRVVIRDGDVRLCVGPRDWQWDRNTGQLIGQGTTIVNQRT